MCGSFVTRLHSPESCGHLLKLCIAVVSCHWEVCDHDGNCPILKNSFSNLHSVLWTQVMTKTEFMALYLFENFIGYKYIIFHNMDFLDILSLHFCFNSFVVFHNDPDPWIQTKRMNIQCDAIRWEQFLRICRLGKLNKAYWDEDNILDLVYTRKYVWIMMILNLYDIIRKCILTFTIVPTQNFMSSLLVCAVFL